MLSRYKWLNDATSKIQFPPDRKAVQRELSGHIEDLCGHYAAAGLDEEAAEEAALKAMGDPGAIAADLGRIHRPWLGYLWWASRVLLIAAAALCCGLAVYQAASGWDRLPGRDLYDYLTWEFKVVADEPEPYELIPVTPSGAVTTGGYTIRAASALMRLNGDPARGPQRWSLIRHFHIDTGWRGEELYWGPNIITDIRDDSGSLYDTWDDDSDKYWLHGSSTAVPFLGQKAAMELNGVPEDTKWIEFDIGHGTLRRTMHIDLREAAS